MIRFWPWLFIAIPLIELYLIIKVGGIIGAFWTVALVVLTAVIGVNLLRIQGFSTLQRAQLNMAQGQLPAMEMLEGVFLAIAGVLLLTPGFLTDAIGFLCLIPASRRAMIRWLLSSPNIHIGGFGPGGFDPGGPGAGGSPFSRPGYTPPPRDRAVDGKTIEGEYTRKD